MAPVHLACRLWRILASAVTICVIAAGSAYILALSSAGNGPVIAVDGGPVESTTRLNLGEPIRYGLKWRYIEGGCDSYVVATFTRQEGREETQLFQRRKARPRAVGQPAYEMIERPLPAGISPGRWHYRVAVESECPTRRPPPVPFVEFDLDVRDPHEPVVTVTSLQVTSPTIRVGDPLH